MSLKILSFIGVFLGLVSQAQAGEWCHVSFQSAEGVKLQLDYSKVVTFGAHGYESTFVTPWLQVSGAGLTGAEQVRVVFIGQERGGVRSAPTDLTYDASRGRFTGEAAFWPRIQEGSNTRPTNQSNLEFAVVINGHWLKDPVSGRSNFVADLNNRPGICE